MVHAELLRKVGSGDNSSLMAMIDKNPDLLQLGGGKYKGILIYGLQYKNAELVEFLLTHYLENVRFELDKKSTDGFNILFYSVMLGDLRSVRNLIEIGGLDIRHRNIEGVSLIDLAKKYSPSVYRMLMNRYSELHDAEVKAQREMERAEIARLLALKAQRLPSGLFAPIEI